VKPPPPKPSPASFVNGIISVNKPVSWTSNEVVTKIRNTISAHLLQENPGVGKKACKIRVGHGGTLDPVATGVLVIGIGKGTKALGTFLKGEKSYKAVGQFGYETDTCDVEGQMQGEAKSYDHVTQEMIEGVLEKFRGKIQQSPPRFSAVRKNGRRAYEWAREGQDFELPARTVFVHSLRLSKPYCETKPAFELELHCGGGTYVRSLIRDIGRELNCAAFMQNLERTRQGQFSLEDCLNDDRMFDGHSILVAVHKSGADLRKGLAEMAVLQQSAGEAAGDDFDSEDHEEHLRDERDEL